ncbi:transposase, partial [Moraxella catarrhalis]|nr:transposase [Moraxella catarrhalis]MPX62242.1 transposase [Moraxella catarrhalis]
WVQLARQAKRLKQTLYQVKHGLLSNYLREQLKSPSVVFA